MGGKGRRGWRERKASGCTTSNTLAAWQTSGIRQSCLKPCNTEKYQQFTSTSLPLSPYSSLHSPSSYSTFLLFLFLFLLLPPPPSWQKERWCDICMTVPASVHLRVVRATWSLHDGVNTFRLVIQDSNIRTIPTDWEKTILQNMNIIYTYVAHKEPYNANGCWNDIRSLFVSSSATLPLISSYIHPELYYSWTWISDHKKP